MLERHEIEAFLTLVEELHFGRTAQRLHVTPTRISQTIRKLERRVGAPLFTRTSRRVEVTEVGRILYDELQPAWARVAAGLRRAIDAGRGVAGTLTVGFVSAAGGQLVARIAERFRAGNPGWEVLIREVQAVSAVSGGTVDVLLTSYPIGSSDLVAPGVLVREARLLAVPTGHPLAQRTSVAEGDLGGLPLLAAEGTTLQEALTLVGAGRGVFPVGSHVRRYYARPDVAYVPIAGAQPVEWGLAWRRSEVRAGVAAFGRAAIEEVG